jgi:hypothetical protein
MISEKIQMVPNFHIITQQTFNGTLLKERTFSVYACSITHWIESIIRYQATINSRTFMQLKPYTLLQL